MIGHSATLRERGFTNIRILHEENGQFGPSRIVISESREYPVPHQSLRFITFNKKRLKVRFYWQGFYLTVHYRGSSGQTGGYRQPAPAAHGMKSSNTLTADPKG